MEIEKQRHMWTAATHACLAIVSTRPYSTLLAVLALFFSPSTHEQRVIQYSIVCALCVCAPANLSLRASNVRAYLTINQISNNKNKRSFCCTLKRKLAQYAIITIHYFNSLHKVQVSATSKAHRLISSWWSQREMSQCAFANFTCVFVCSWKLYMCICIES